MHIHYFTIGLVGRVETRFVNTQFVFPLLVACEVRVQAN